MNPAVSVCIPTYNRALLLEKTIRSALHQTIQNFEIVVVDNNSEDNTENIVSSFCDQQIRFFKNSTNIGMVANFNRCVALARGRYVSILHSDDYFESEILALETHFLDQHPEVGMVYSGYFVAQELTGQKKTVLPHGGSRIFTTNSHINSLVRRGNYIAFSSVMVRKRCFEEIGEFNTSLPFASDMDMWLRISLRYPVGYLALPLVTYRFHRDMDSFSFFKSTEAIDQELRAITLAIDRFQYPKTVRGQLLRRARKHLASRTVKRAFFHADKGMSLVRGHLLKAAAISPKIRFHPSYWFVYAFSLMGDRIFSRLNRLRTARCRLSSS